MGSASRKNPESLRRVSYWIVGLSTAILASRTCTASGISLSLRLEVRFAMRRGCDFLLAQQREDGSWAGNPVITSYAALALANSPALPPERSSPAVNRAAAFVASNARPDGAIRNASRERHPVLATAWSMLILIRTDLQGNASLLRKARAFLLHSRQSTEEAVPVGFSPAPGGSPDLITTQAVLEALYLSNDLATDKADRTAARQACAAGLAFVLACRRTGGTDEMSKPGRAVDAFDLPGAFGPRPPSVPRPSDEAFPLPYDLPLLTCWGLRGLLYGGMSPDDPRVRDAVGWLRQYAGARLDRPAGRTPLLLLHALARVAVAFEDRGIALLSGDAGTWRRQILNAVLAVQTGDGGWEESAPDGWGAHREFMTACAVLTLGTVGGETAADSRTEEKE